LVTVARYTGREFILPNMAFNDLPSYVNIELDLGEPFRRGFLFSGYCRIGDTGGAGSASGSGGSASVQSNAQHLWIRLGRQPSRVIDRWSPDL
jgi:hypothetical protein